MHMSECTCVMYVCVCLCIHSDMFHSYVMISVCVLYVDESFKLCIGVLGSGKMGDSCM